MRTTPFTKPDTYVSCPQCGKGEHGVGHLPVGTKTAWYCDYEGCGRRFSLEVLPGGDINLRPMDEWAIPALVTLRSVEPVTVVVKSSVLVRHLPPATPEEMEEGQRYFYEEHTCPMNFLRVKEVRTDAGDKDPHGIFAFVGIAQLDQKNKS